MDQIIQSLLCEFTQLKTSEIEPDGKQLQSLREHIITYENINTQSITVTELNDMKYCLIAALDEAVLQQEALHHYWLEYKASSKTPGEKFSGNHFYQLIHKYRNTQNTHIAKIQYLLLSLGFKGKAALDEMTAHEDCSQLAGHFNNAFTRFSHSQELPPMATHKMTLKSYIIVTCFIIVSSLGYLNGFENPHIKDLQLTHFITTAESQYVTT